MGESKQKLTVAYGSFSCTVEGFEDAFEAMKSVAEYFRELSERDREFGMLPSLPDPEMIRRLAEIDTGEEVDARVGAQSVSLRRRDPASARRTIPGESVATRLARIRASAVRGRDIGTDRMPSIFAEDEHIPTPKVKPPTMPAESLKPEAPQQDQMRQDPPRPEARPGTPARSIPESPAAAAPGPAATFHSRRDHADGGEPSAAPKVEPAAARPDAPAPDAPAPDAPARDAARPDAGKAAATAPVLLGPQMAAKPAAAPASPADRAPETDPAGTASGPAPVPLRSPPPAEKDLDRLMETVKTQIDDSDIRRRLDSVAHQKAAVAAASADKKPGSDSEDSAGGNADETSRYREDLSRAVGNEPEEKKPAPARTGQPNLRVVSGQSQPKVAPAPDPLSDEPQNAAPPAAAAAPAAPAPAAPGSDPDFDDEDSHGEPPRKPEVPFRVFAEAADPMDLTELMEVAAAYLTLQEGRDDFSRMQVMALIENVGLEDAPSREEGIKSFGDLIRRGLILRIDRSRFKVSGASRFIDRPGPAA